MRIKVPYYFKKILHAVAIVACTGFLASCVTLEPYEGGFSETNKFEKLSDKSCIVTAIKETKSTHFISQDHWQDDHTQNFWGKRINSQSFRYAYSIDGISGERGHVVIKEFENNDLTFENGFGHNGVGLFSSAQKDQIVDVINEMNSKIKNECKISNDLPTAKKIDR